MADLDPQLPVLVGAGAVMQRCDDPADAVEAVELMIRAAWSAANDAGAAGLLADIAWVGVPEGNWSYPDPGRIVARALGAPRARTVVADVGVLQQQLFTRACELIAAGDIDVALVTGGEARFRQQQAKRVGLEADERAQPEVEPDERWRPSTLGIADIEMIRGIVHPVVSFALIDRALAGHEGWSVGEHRDRLAALWHRFGEVAAANPAAWDRSAPAASAIREPEGGNRMIAFPYTRLMASQWTVDQAGAVLLCSVGAARRHGVADDRLVFPWASSVCDHAVPLVQRAALHRSPGAAVAARRLFDAVGVEGIAAVRHIDLYSCFPSAVQVMAAEVGLALEAPYDDPPTVTGGMSFAGGPLNNYVIQALVALVERLRGDPGSLGLSSSVSTFLTKQGLSLWSTRPPPSGSFVPIDVTTEVAAADLPRPLADPERAGEVVVVASTVDHGLPDARVLAVCEHLDGARTVAGTSDPSCVERLEAGDPAFDVGARASMSGDGELTFAPPNP